MQLEIRPKPALAKDFNSGLYELITMAEKKARDEMTINNLDRAKKRLSLLISTMGDITPLNEAYPFWIDYSDNILETNQTKREQFFLTLDIKAEYKKYGKVIKPEDEFLFSLTDAIRELYKRSPETDKTRVYSIVRRLLDCSLEYAAQLA